LIPLNAARISDASPVKAIAGVPSNVILPVVPLLIAINCSKSPNALVTVTAPL
jgi:hypothetical protein